ncbi:cytochrome c554/c'-like protein [Blastomonas natatoria]|uniref:Cytochrome c554/c'-like protein n=1 Tax=Blastomonas natatoria TaxID=34015 RepID=A0A2V3VCJ1_9SPHN|nr:cytochrome c554/c'-like protein [Blastomonas natatoria]
MHNSGLLAVHSLGGIRAAFAGAACLALAIGAFFIANFAAADRLEAQAGAAARGTHMGVGSCAGSTCHGRNEADGEVVRQDELWRWQEESTPGGAHARAFRVLGEPRSLAIGKKLGIGDPRSAAMCLGCHSTPAAARGPRYQVSDGVSCEACHGAASGWLSSHYATGTSHARNVSQGLIPLENAQARAGVCLDCHLGNDAPGQFVNHRIMAAGHPRISFELDLFSTLTQHHDEDVDYRQRKGRTNNMRMWAVGQAIALERSLSLFGKPGIGQEGAFPEFYFFDCHSCHRRIYDEEDARPAKLANPGRPIPTGMPPYNDENMIMLSAAVRVAAPGMAQQYEAQTRAFHAAMAQGRGPAVEAANRLRQTAMALADQFSRTDFTRAQTFSIMETIASEAIAPRFTDYEGSVQAVMAVDTLLSGLVTQGQVSGGAATSLRAQINQAYAAVAEPNAYQPLEFRRALGGAVRTIRSLQ